MQREAKVLAGLAGTDLPHSAQGPFLRHWLATPTPSQLAESPRKSQLDDRHVLIAMSTLRFVATSDGCHLAARLLSSLPEQQFP
jgi:hypothetical protein